MVLNQKIKIEYTFIHVKKENKPEVNTITLIFQMSENSVERWQVVNVRTKFKSSFYHQNLWLLGLSKYVELFTVSWTSLIISLLAWMYILPVMFFLIGPLVGSKTSVLQEQISCVFSSVKPPVLNQAELMALSCHSPCPGPNR